MSRRSKQAVTLQLVTSQVNSLHRCCTRGAFPRPGSALKKVGSFMSANIQRRVECSSSSRSSNRSLRPLQDDLRYSLPAWNAAHGLVTFSPYTLCITLSLIGYSLYLWNLSCELHDLDYRTLLSRAFYCIDRSHFASWGYLTWEVALFVILCNKNLCVIKARLLKYLV